MYYLFKDSQNNYIIFNPQTWKSSKKWGKLFTILNQNLVNAGAWSFPKNASLAEVKRHAKEIRYKIIYHSNEQPTIELLKNSPELFL